MKTPFDFVSVGMFALIAVIFLHRSAQPGRDPVPLWSYGATAAACAGGDILTNNGYVLIGAAFLLLAAAGAIWIVFKAIPAAK